MNRLFFLAIAVFCFIFLGQCENIPDYTDSGPVNNVPPGVVTDVSAEPTPGGVIIHYTPPSDSDLLAVKALYSYTEGGQLLEAFSSAFSNSISLSGFPDMQTRTIKLVSLNESMVESAPVEVSFAPLMPPVEMVRQTLEAAATFGGVMINWENPTRADIGITLFVEDDDGSMRLDFTYFTNATDGKYAFRGHDDTERKFQLVVRDRWENRSTPLDTVLKPFHEVPIIGMDDNGNAIWQRYQFTAVVGQISGNPESVARGDAPRQNQDGQALADIRNMMDGTDVTYLHFGTVGNQLGDFTGNTAQNNIRVLPWYLTIDLGRSSMLSRHRLFHRRSTVLRDLNLRSYELWATNETPKSLADFQDFDDPRLASLAYWTSWEEVDGTDQWKTEGGWVKIAECFTLPPSGARTVSEVTEADRQWAIENGFDFDILPEFLDMPFRYVRIVSGANWTEGTGINIGEFQLWGSYVE